MGSKSIEMRPISGFIKILVVASVCCLMTATGALAQTFSVSYPTHSQLSPRMSELHGSPMVTGPTVIHRPLKPHSGAGNVGIPDGALQTSSGSLVSSTVGVSFDGMSVYNGGYIPSDNNIAVGPNHVVEVVNAAYAVYSKSGATILQPVALKNLWTKLTGSSCAANNGGDAVVQYDRAADRWMVTQLGSLSSPYSECIAVSTTNDPTGAFNLYSYSFGSNLNDYPKFGVWSTPSNSAYLATYNLFANGRSFVGPEICAYDRSAMLSGALNPAALCYTGISGASFLPSDVDGPTAPLDGTPAYFMNLNGSSLGVYKLTPNFATATATLSSYSTIGIAGYSSASSSPQPGTTRTLDSLSDRLMYRLAFRMFSDHESIVVNHSVVGSSANNSGVRWYELRSPVSANGSFSMYQQGTFAPDTSYRWMGSAAMDQAGDIAVGYSVSDGTSVYPSVRYTGRTPSDSLGTMESEDVIMAGAGSQTGYTRWGDYSSMRIDPSDDCTLWYVNEYYPLTSSYGWYTRIGSFKFSGCGSTTPDFSISDNPGSQSVTAGSTATSTISVAAINGFTDNVNLSQTGCPTGATCSFNPTTVAPGGSSTLSVVTSSSTPAGSYPVTVTGTDPITSQTHSTVFTVTVTAPAVNFTVSVSPTSLTVSRGSSGSVTVNVGMVGSSTSVTLSASGLPKGAKASFSPNPVTSGNSSKLTISAVRKAARGTSTVTISGTNGSFTHTASLTLTIK